MSFVSKLFSDRRTDIYKSVEVASGLNIFSSLNYLLIISQVHNLICTKRFYSSPSAIKCFKCEHIFSAYKNFREHIESAHEDLLPGIIYMPFFC